MQPGDLEKKMSELLDLRNDVNHQVESAEEDGRLPTAQVKNWLRDVEVNKTQRSIAEINKTKRFVVVSLIGEEDVDLEEK